MLQLGSSTLEGLLQVFNSYIDLLIHALPGTLDTEDQSGGSGHKNVRMAETEAQQLALLANASMLADELLPRGAMKLLNMQQTNRMDNQARASDRQNRAPEHRDWKRKLQRGVDRLRDSFCRQHALELIFTEEGEIRLTAETYTSMEGNMNEAEWFPTPIFQVIQYETCKTGLRCLYKFIMYPSRSSGYFFSFFFPFFVLFIKEFFTKLSEIASIAMDIFVGRERFATILLMRLTETVILWLSDDQNFWGEIEDGPRPLTACGLQQVPSSSFKNNS